MSLRVRVRVVLMSALLGFCWGVLAGALTDWRSPSYSLLASPLIGTIAGELARRYRLYEGFGSILGGLGLLLLTTGLYGAGWGACDGGPHWAGEMLSTALLTMWVAMTMEIWFLWPLASLSTLLIGWTIRQSAA